MFKKRGVPFFSIDKLSTSLKPIKVCQQCKDRTEAVVMRHEVLAKELKEYGITQAIGETFVMNVMMEHDEFMVQVIASFVVAVAKNEFKEGAEAATKRFVKEFMEVQFIITKKTFKAMNAIVPEEQCQFHAQQNIDEEMMGDEGPAPANVGPMFR